jgi:hypothetical protein
METTPQIKNQRIEAKIIATIAQRDARLAEYRPLPVQPEVPLQDDRKVKVVATRVGVPVDLDTHRHVRVGRRDEASALAPGSPILHSVMDPVESDSDSDGVVVIRGESAA